MARTTPVGSLPIQHECSTKSAAPGAAITPCNSKFASPSPQSHFFLCHHMRHTVQQGLCTVPNIDVEVYGHLHTVVDVVPRSLDSQVGANLLRPYSYYCGERRFNILPLKQIDHATTGLIA